MIDVMKFNKILELLIFMSRCYDDGAHVDEELFPALGETNPLLKNKKVSTVRLTCPVYVGVAVKDPCL